MHGMVKTSKYQEHKHIVRKLFLLYCHHRLCGSGSTVVTITSKVNGKFLPPPPVDLNVLC